MICFWKGDSGIGSLKVFLKHHFEFRQTCREADNQGEEQKGDHNSDEMDYLVTINIDMKT